ncbi:hypothetical protein STIUS_v1c01110 [Spiroplasma sp. TIUS-1]|uniref:ABC transporter substrate-binding protein n=1 Tax=Spiroplasma sp. TIUS-1 TaxID=216963 RepID=UPI001397BA85|nr:ABC transporter substrate-binding protein [Spiroplasma sp. TIUS-1]QHX35666.1 hypothetical protein STIUS_v1c01110 [Spiroplasma sp. TIUS-1]
MKKLISLFSIFSITVPTALLLISCGPIESKNVIMWIESNPNSPSLQGYIEAAEEFNVDRDIKVEVKNVAKGNMERELLSNKYAPSIINGSMDRTFRVQQIRSEEIMPIQFEKSMAYDYSFLEYGQDKDGNQLMVPVGKSFSVLLINKTLLKEVDESFDESTPDDELIEYIFENVESLIKSLEKKDKSKLMGIDDLSDLINLQFARKEKINTTKQNDDYLFNYYNETLIVNKKAIDTIDPLMSKLNKIRNSLVMTSGSTRPSNDFSKQKLLMTTASSAGLKYYNTSKEGWDPNIAIINLPNNSDNFMVQRGDGLIALKSGSKEKQNVAEEFVVSLIESKDLWSTSASASGYIPWTSNELSGDFKFEDGAPEQKVLEIVKSKDTKQFSIEANESSGLYDQFIFNELFVNILKSKNGWNKERVLVDNKDAFENASKSRRVVYR